MDVWVVSKDFPSSKGVLSGNGRGHRGNSPKPIREFEAEIHATTIRMTRAARPSALSL